MIQVYKKNDLFIILDTITDMLYPNLTEQEAKKLLLEFEREEDRTDYAITIFEDSEFRFCDLVDKDHEIAVLKQALSLAVEDKCKFQDAYLSEVLKKENAKLAVPKKEQWYIEQAEKELKEAEN